MSVQKNIKHARLSETLLHQILVRKAAVAVALLVQYFVCRVICYFARLSDAARQPSSTLQKIIIYHDADSAAVIAPLYVPLLEPAHVHTQWMRLMLHSRSNHSGLPSGVAIVYIFARTSVGHSITIQVSADEAAASVATVWS